jgi:F-type H+-transporting ATPase subunit gamma
MAERLADVVTQIQNVQQLEAVVTAMRGIAASRAQRGRALLPEIDAYSGVVAQAIGSALSLLPAGAAPAAHPRPARLGLVLFCAEQGFAGAFSERVLDAVAADLSGALSVMVGTRGAALARERGLTPVRTVAMATHVDAIPTLASELADDLYEHVATAGLSKVDVVLARSASGGGVQVDRRSLLPLDFGRFTRPVESQPPLTTLPPELLLERLAAEYVYAQLCEAAMHAFEAENEARMMAMASARTNIETKLSALSVKEKQLRQQEITTEIVELAAGAEASQRGTESIRGRAGGKT